MTTKKLLLGFFLLISSVHFVQAQTNTWTGAVNNNWGTAGNWSLAEVPTATQDAVIPSGFTVNLNVSATINSLQVQGTSTFNWSQQLSIASASNFGPNSTVNWNVGNLTGGGTLTNQGLLDHTTTSNTSILGFTTLNNEGTFIISGTGDIFVSDGILNNVATGTIDFKSDNAQLNFSGTASRVVNNTGTIRKSGGSGTTIIFPELNNTGTLAVESGTLTLQSLDKNLTDGVYNVSAGASLSWNGPIVLSGTLTGTLDGPIEWNNITSVPITATFNFSGTTGVHWRNGSLAGGGTLTNLGILDLPTASNVVISDVTTLTNEGSMTMQSTGDLFINDGIVNNQASGSIDIQANAANITFSGTASRILNNAGIIRKTTSTGTSVIDVALNNTGTISVESGGLTFQSLNKNLNGGVYNVSPTAVLTWNSPVTCAGTLTGTLDGPISWSNTTNVVTSATFDFDGDAGVDWNNGSLAGGGTLTNLGILDLPSTANVLITGVTILENQGTITLQNVGDLFINDGIVNNRPSGIIDVQANAAQISYSGTATRVLNNEGLIRKSVTGISGIDVELNNTGTISVETGGLTLGFLDKNLNGGIYNVTSGATLTWNGPVNCTGVLTGTLDGPIAWRQTVTVANSDTATFNFSGSAGVDWENGTLTGGGTLINMGLLDMPSFSNVIISGFTSLNNEGMFRIQSSGDLFVNDGVVNNQPSGTIDFQNNSGQINWSGTDSHILNNAGLLTKTGGTGVSIIYTETTNTGTIDIASGEIEFSGANSLNNTSSGIIKGIGTLDLPAAIDFTNDGTFAPGASPGTLDVQGDFESSASSVLDVELEGYIAGTEYDVLAINGNAIMEGNVNVTMGFDATVGDIFTIATTTGTITTCNLAQPNNSVFNGFEYEFSVDCSTIPDEVNLTITDKTDVEPPTVVTQDITVFLASDGTVTIAATDVDNGSSDNFSPQANLTYAIDISDFSCADVGDNIIMLTVTDEAGNSASGPATVTVLGTPTTFTSGTWSAGTPNVGSNAIIAGNYDTGSEGSIDTCTCEVDASGILNIAAEDYLFSANNITVNGSLLIAHQGSVVQEYDFAQVVKNGTIETEVITPDLASRDFMVMGSPMTAETRNGVFASAFLVLNHNTLNFSPNTDVAMDFPMAENFADDNGDFWNAYSGNINVGEGYIVRPQAGYGEPGGIFTMTYEQGTLNNGVVNRPIIYNTPGPTAADNRNASPNVLANPYASAIDADALLTANPLFGEIYFWEHLTPPSPSLPGAGSMNFSMEDISMYNLMGGTAAAADPSGIDTEPNGVISTAQGFGVKATAAGTAVFNNSMRLTSGNTTLRSPINKDRMWLKVQSTAYALQSNCLIGFTSEATEGIDLGYDSNRLATVLSIYSGIEGLDTELGIQSLPVFDEELMVPIGFSTLVDENTTYKISLAQLDSPLLSGTTIYLYDSYLDTLTLLTETAYGFSSEKGNFPDRFQLIFQPENILNVQGTVSNTFVLYPNPASDYVMIGGLSESATIMLIDMSGRLVHTTQTDAQGTSQRIMLPQLPEGVYTVVVQTEKGKQTKKLIIQ